jgi:hypothetical protein
MNRGERRGGGWRGEEEGEREDEKRELEENE